MPRLPRLLPTVLVAIILLFGTKLGFIWRDAGIAMAEPAAPAPSADDTRKEGDAPAASKPPESKQPEHFSPQEIQLLQELSKRRTEIEQRGEELDRREALLKAAEQRVDEKIARLQQLQTAIDTTIGKVEQQDDQHITSLVHIYENMKPQDAARIFEGMDIPALLQLLGRMKDLKTAPILAAMAPDKARAVTIAMAQRKDIPDVKTN